ncbi:MAG: FAD-dependent oxidoreductase [Bacteroidia bacterium]
MKKKVIVLGGGVAGMSAAHELAERGFDVEVYEQNEYYVGGKARSVDVPGTNLLHPDKYLPGEHGFRFFPGFYKHVTDTMKRIPFKKDEKVSNCFQNLVPTSRIMLARYDLPPVVFPASFPRSIKDIKLILSDLSGKLNTGLSKDEIEFFAARIWQCMTSSKLRKFEEYEKISWWDFMEADRFSDAYRHLLVEGLTRSLVAARAEVASMKTGSSVTLQLMYCMWDPTVNTDRVLNGPTNDQWLLPWLAYLKEKGVKYHHGYKVSKILLNDKKPDGVLVTDKSGKTEKVTGDYYILAVPVEQAVTLVNDDMIKADSSLGTLEQLNKSTAWMNGIQYYLNEDVQISEGHVCYSYSQWAVTSISQMQFWKGYDIEKRYNGKVKGVLSVDISDWLYTQYKGEYAENCDPQTIMKYTWEQIKKSVNIDGKEILRDDMIEYWYLDRDIKWNGAKHKNEDAEPLLINSVNSWALRPEARTQIPGFYLAADYVRTNTDLATMEGANEAARRAVNSIIDDSGINAPFCKIWDLHEPALFLPLKWWDERRFKKGLKWSSKFPFWLDIFMVIWSGCYLMLITIYLVLIKIIKK